MSIVIKIFTNTTQNNTITIIIKITEQKQTKFDCIKSYNDMKRQTSLPLHNLTISHGRHSVQIDDGVTYVIICMSQPLTPFQYNTLPNTISKI